MVKHNIAIQIIGWQRSVASINYNAIICFSDLFLFLEEAAMENQIPTTSEGNTLFNNYFNRTILHRRLLYFD